jgi:hypothetical protein
MPFDTFQLSKVRDGQMHDGKFFPDVIGCRVWSSMRVDDRRPAWLPPSGGVGGQCRCGVEECACRLSVPSMLIGPCGGRERVRDLRPLLVKRAIQHPACQMRRSSLVTPPFLIVWAAVGGDGEISLHTVATPAEGPRGQL